MCHSPCSCYRFLASRECVHSPGGTPERCSSRSCQPNPYAHLTPPRTHLSVMRAIDTPSISPEVWDRLSISRPLASASCPRKKQKASPGASWEGVQEDGRGPGLRGRSGQARVTWPLGYQVLSTESLRPLTGHTSLSALARAPLISHSLRSYSERLSE